MRAIGFHLQKKLPFSLLQKSLVVILGAQYRRLSKGRGIKRAAVAVGHSILLIYYHMLTTSGSYEEKGEDYFIHHDQQEKQRRLVKQLERLGFTVNLTPNPSASVFFPAESPLDSDQEGVFVSFHAVFRGKA